MGEAGGLAEAAFEELIINNKIVVPLLLSTFSSREQDNPLGVPAPEGVPHYPVGQGPYRSIIRGGMAIHQRLKNLKAADNS